MGFIILRLQQHITIIDILTCNFAQEKDTFEINISEHAWRYFCLNEIIELFVPLMHVIFTMIVSDFLLIINGKLLAKSNGKFNLFLLLHQ